MLLSGRVTRYEVCLLPILEKSNLDIDLFISINGENCEYYEIMKIKLSKWLKGVNIHPYIIPEDFHANFIDDHRHCFQLINNKWVPRNQLSMYYNDNLAFNMALEYSNKNNFEYDIFMRFRADLFNTDLPDLNNFDKNNDILYSINPQCYFTGFGIYNVGIISSDWVWGNKNVMSVYCNTYNYVLDKCRILNGNYIVHYESNHTDNIYENKVKIEYVNIRYNIDKHRKVFDENWKLNENNKYNDSRKVHIPGANPYINIDTVKTTENIPVEPE